MAKKSLDLQSKNQRFLKLFIGISLVLCLQNDMTYFKSEAIRFSPKSQFANRQFTFLPLPLPSGKSLVASITAQLDFFI